MLRHLAEDAVPVVSNHNAAHRVQQHLQHRPDGVIQTFKPGSMDVRDGCGTVRQGAVYGMARYGTRRHRSTIITLRLVVRDLSKTAEIAGTSSKGSEVGYTVRCIRQCKTPHCCCNLDGSPGASEKSSCRLAVLSSSPMVSSHISCRVFRRRGRVVQLPNSNRVLNTRHKSSTVYYNQGNTPP